LGLIERTWKVKTPRWLNIVSQAGTMMIAHAKLGNEGTVRLIWTNLQNYINSTNPGTVVRVKSSFLDLTRMNNQFIRCHEASFR
jgi:hypothetical protein